MAGKAWNTGNTETFYEARTQEGLERTKSETSLGLIGWPGFFPYQAFLPINGLSLSPGDKYIPKPLLWGSKMSIFVE